MNNYQFLFLEREQGNFNEYLHRGQGNFNEYLHRGLIGSNLLLWLDVYEFHLTHPKASTWSVANKFHIDQKHVRNIYAFMETEGKN